MALTVTINNDNRGRPQKYPYRKWLKLIHDVSDGMPNNTGRITAVRFTHGRDFTCKPMTFVNQMRRYGNDYNMPISARVEDDHVYIWPRVRRSKRAAPPEQQPAETEAAT